MSIPRLFVIGDSISMQYGPYLQRYLQGVFSYNRKGGIETSLTDIEIPKEANGGDSAMVLLYLQTIAKSKAFGADVILLNCGLHDIKTTPGTETKQVPIEAYRRNLQQIIPVCRALARHLVWIRTTPADEAIHNRVSSGFHRFARDVVAYNAVADEVMTAAGVPRLDLFTFTANLGTSQEIFCDHVHFPEPIREKHGAFIAGWLDAWWQGAQK